MGQEEGFLVARQVGSDRWQSGSIETACEQLVRPEEIKPVWSEAMENENGDDSHKDDDEEMVLHDGGVGAGRSRHDGGFIWARFICWPREVGQDVRMSEDEQGDGPRGGCGRRTTSAQRNASTSLG